MTETGLVQTIQIKLHDKLTDQIEGPSSLEEVLTQFSQRPSLYPSSLSNQKVQQPLNPKSRDLAVK